MVVLCQRRDVDNGEKVVVAFGGNGQLGGKRMRTIKGMEGKSKMYKWILSLINFYYSLSTK